MTDSSGTSSIEDQPTGVHVLPVKHRVLANCITEDHLEGHHFAVYVEYRGRNLWAVTHMGVCLGRAGGWDHEPSPSNRTDSWIADHRFDFDTALKLAIEVAERVKIGGNMTAREYAAWQAEADA
ncbi:hypothetical protein SEA_ECLIPTUS_89 [Gordonia phage Ecliptus]|uniref:Uncharacterized protein n=1 Tax=Gordonia phage Apricot TaxID=2250319 RepID=A0A345L189_9CAUD|nr:hypothetical protein HOT72_gp082 [Gordonia phage Apricot]AXH49041.1 hypothetical protein SEA_APRICOT_82 [Gordonia phage Apricot]WAB10654.1 hypothetical protein SEA_ECLIPTUS_89 [Gordonia phage Ecliptus]